MNRRSFLLAIGLVLSVTLSAQAQFSFGFGTGGGGSGFYFGRGGMYYGSPYFGPSYYGPGYYGGYYGRGYYPYGYGYGSGIGIRVGPRYYDDYDYRYGGYRYAPSYRYDAGRRYYSEQPTATFALPSNRIDPAAESEPDSRPSTPPNLQEGDILLRSPGDAPAAVGYGINDRWVYTMKPGQKQKLQAGRDWTIEFDRGIEGAETARYSLSPGIYHFSYSEESGWDLVKQRADTVDDLLLPPEAPPVEESTAPPVADEN